MTKAQRQYADKMAKKYGIPTSLFRSMIRFESGGRQQAKSGAGAIGLTQLMPGTAEGLGVNPYNWRQNLEGGARYLRQQYDKFAKRWDLALSAYNSGPAGAESQGRIENFDETKRHVRKVLAHAAKLPARELPVTAISPRRSPRQLQPKRELQAVQKMGPGLSTGQLAGINATYNLIGLDPLPENLLAEPIVMPRAPVRQTIRTKLPGAAGTVSPASAKAGSMRGAQLMLATIDEARRRGLSVRENPLVDRVDPVHTSGSHHYRLFPGTYRGKKLGRGADISGDPAQLRSLFQWIAKRNPNVPELILDSMGSIFDGRRSKRPYGGHEHLHLGL